MTQALATTAATQPLSESEALQPVTLTKRDVERLINLGLERGRAEATPSRIGGMTIGEAQAWAVVIRTAGLIPQEKSKQPVTPIEVLEARAVAKIMAGNSWGINPFEAQSLFHFIPQSGTIVPHYKAFLMRIKLSGKYDYEIVELTDEKCTLRGFKHGQPLVPDVTFTLEEAIQAGLYNPKLAAGEEKWPDGNVKQKGAWEAYTKDKLLARATTRLFGRHFPELYSSMPVTKTVEDLEDEGILAAQPAQIAAPVVDPADEPFSSVANGAASAPAYAPETYTEEIEYLDALELAAAADEEDEPIDAEPPVDPDEAKRLEYLDAIDSKLAAAFELDVRAREKFLKGRVPTNMPLDKLADLYSELCGEEENG